MANDADIPSCATVSIGKLLIQIHPILLLIYKSFWYALVKLHIRNTLGKYFFLLSLSLHLIKGQVYVLHMAV